MRVPESIRDPCQDYCEDQKRLSCDIYYWYPYHLCLFVYYTSPVDIIIFNRASGMI